MNSSFFLRYVARFLLSQIPQAGLWALYNTNNIQFQHLINKILFDLTAGGVAACQVNYTNDMEIPYLQGFNDAGFPLGFGERPDYSPTNYTTSFSYYPSRNMVPRMDEIQDRIFWGFASLILLTGAAATGIKFFRDRHKPYIRALEIEIKELENAVADVTMDEAMEQRITDDIIRLFHPSLPNPIQASEALDALGLMDSETQQFIGLDPVIFPNGYSISRAAFNELIENSENDSIDSPQTNVSYPINTIHPNPLLRHITTILAKDFLAPQVQNTINILERKREKLEAYTQPAIWDKLIKFTYWGGFSAFILLVDNILLWNLTPAFIRETALYKFGDCCNTFFNTTGLIPEGPQAFFNSGNESGVLAGQCSATQDDITVCNPRYFSLPTNDLSRYCSLPSSEPHNVPAAVILIVFLLWMALLSYFHFMRYFYPELDKKDAADMDRLPVAEPEEGRLLPPRSADEEITVVDENGENLQEAYANSGEAPNTKFFTRLCNPKTSLGQQAGKYLASNQDVTIPGSYTKDYASTAFFNHARALFRLKDPQQANIQGAQHGYSQNSA